MCGRGSLTGRRVRPPFPSPVESAALVGDDNQEPTIEQDAWDLKDQHAFAILIKSLSSKVAVQFSSNNTSKELLEAIHSRYEWSSDQRLIHLQMQFEKQTIYEGDSIREKITEFITLKDKMAAIGSPMSDREFSPRLLSRLTPSWEPFVDNITLKKSPPTFESLVTLIFDKEDRRSLNSKDDAGGAFASNSKFMKKKGKNVPSNANSDLALASTTIGKPVRNPNHKDLTCHYCGKKGHISPNCHKKRDFQNKGGASTVDVATKANQKQKLFSNPRFVSMPLTQWSG